MNKNELNIDELGDDGLPLYDENGEKYDVTIILTEKRKTCGKPRQYEEGWLERYKKTGYYSEYSKRISKVKVKCELCGTMSSKTCINQHKKTSKCKMLREKLEAEAEIEV